MKYFLTPIFILFFAVFVGAQDKENVLKATASYGKILEDANIKTMAFEYQRNIGLGIYAIVSHSRGQGGTPLSKRLTDQEFVRLSELNQLESYSGIGSGFLITFVQTSTYGLGIQKNVQLSNNMHFGLSAKATLTNLSHTQMSGIEYDINGDLIFDSLQEAFNTRTEKGGEIGLHVMLNIKSYAYIGLSIKYLTNPKLTQAGIFTSISF